MLALLSGRQWSSAWTDLVRVTTDNPCGNVTHWPDPIIKNLTVEGYSVGVALEFPCCRNKFWKKQCRFNSCQIKIDLKRQTFSPSSMRVTVILRGSRFSRRTLNPQPVDAMLIGKSYRRAGIYEPDLGDAAFRRAEKAKNLVEHESVPKHAQAPE